MMGCKRRFILGSWAVLILAWAVSSGAQGQAPQLRESLSWVEVKLVGDGTVGPYPLPGSFILVDTEKVWVGERPLVRDKDYEIDYNRRQITFHQPLPPGVEVWVEYQRLPVKLKSSYTHRSPEARERSEKQVAKGVIKPSPQIPDEVSQPGASLRIGGTKSLGISIGSGRDLALEQSLRVNISGNVARDVEVVAFLSDESSPIQPEGYTQTLEELDRVFVEVRGTNLKATLGDYYLSLQGTEFGRLDRKLEGVRGEADYPNAQVVVAGAVSRGEFTTNRFMGVEGKQGPYQLWDKEGATDIVVLAGTERVWVDGEPVVRGQNNDYIIDYSTGQITFTQRCLITAESRIVVDFEYANQGYKRDLYCGKGRFNLWDGKLRLGTTFVQEADDPSSPLISPSLAPVDSEPTLEGRAPVSLPAPTSHSLYDLDLVFAPSDLSHLRAEVALSRFDPNASSNPEANPVKLGKAYNLVGTLSPLQGLDLSAKYRFLGQGFSPLGRIDRVEYDRRWDLPPGLDAGQETVWELEGAYRSLPGSELSLELGRIRRAGGFWAVRGELGSCLNLYPYPNLKYWREEIKSHWNEASVDSGTEAGELIGHWVRQGFEGDYTFWRLKPRLALMGERKEQLGASRSGFRFHEVTGGISTVGLGQVAASVEYEYRDDDRLGFPGSGSEGWGDESTSRTWTHRFSLREWQALNLNAEYTHRVKSFQRDPGGDGKSDLADLKLSYSPWRRALSTELHYQISNLQEGRKEQWFEEVGEWQGDYRWDEATGEYIYAPGQRESRWVLRWRSVGDSEPVIELKSSARLQLVPYRLLSKRSSFWGWLAQAFSTDTYFKVEESTRERDRKAIYFLNLDKFQRDEVTLQGNLTLRQDLFLFPTSRAFNLRLRYLRSDDEQNSFLSANEERLRFERSLRARWWLKRRWAFQFDYAQGQLNRKLDDRLQYDIRSHSLTLEVSHRPRPPLEVSWGAEYDRDRDLVSSRKAVAVTFSPRVSYSFRGRGRAWANLRWTHVHAEPEGTTLPYRMAGGDPVGDSFGWNLRLDYRLSRYLTALVSYSGRSHSGQRIIHSGRAEMRAYF